MDKDVSWDSTWGGTACHAVWDSMLCGAACEVGPECCGTACYVGQPTTGAQFCVGQHNRRDSMLCGTASWVRQNGGTQDLNGPRSPKRSRRSKRKQTQASAVGHSWFPEHPGIALLVL